MSEHSDIFERVVLPAPALTEKEKWLVGFEPRYQRIRNQLNLLLFADDVTAWNKKYHNGKLAVARLVAEQYPLAIFFGDIGTGKSATAECVANRLVVESKTEDSELFRLTNSVRGSGRVGEMGTLLTSAFDAVRKAAGSKRRAIVVIDEGDSLAASRAQEHSHHEDRVGVNTLIQCIDGLRDFHGRILTILCTNRVTALDPALQRRASILEEFKRPNDDERRQLFAMDLGDLNLTPHQVEELVAMTGPRHGEPSWTFSDIRARLYPQALAGAFPSRELRFDDLVGSARELHASPVMEST